MMLGREAVFTTPDGITHIFMEVRPQNVYLLAFACAPERFLHTSVWAGTPRGREQSKGMIDCMSCLVRAGL